ncbi:MAG TPA: DUF1326 domain-containing protein [Terriglobales bacterium]|nr:DUF1326 domain-containing protein [Terriglobales bacterium]
MRKAALFAVALLFFSVSLQAQQIRGDYIESRSTDVYVAQCFANGEVGLTGNFALMAWHVQEGSWNGVKLDGLTVAAAVRARATLGDPYGDPYPAEAVLMVDDAANAQQRQALIALAQHEGGRLLENVARVEYVPVVLDVPQNPHEGHAVLRAGHLATIATRPLNHNDHICGNESDFYPPLTNVQHATSAVALTDEFRGDGLGSQWSMHGKRSAYIASFSEGGDTVASIAGEPAIHQAVGGQ